MTSLEHPIESLSEVSATLDRGKWMVLLAAFLGWMFDGLEMGIFPLVARPALTSLLQGTVASEDLAGGIREFLSKPRSMKEIADWLQSKGVAFSANRGVRAAEQIPLVMLPKLQAMTKGEIQPFEAMPGRYQVIRVVDFLEAPMDEATAAPRIERFLFNQVSGAAVAREMNEIRKQAKIEYLGEFAERAAAPEAKKGEAEVKSFSEAEAKAEADAQARARDSAAKQGQK